MQLQDSRSAKARQTAAHEAAIAALHTEIDSVQQQLTSFVEEAAAAGTRAASLKDAAAAAEAAHQHAVSLLQSSASEKDRMVEILQDQCKRAEAAYEEALQSASSAETEQQAVVESLRQQLDDALHQVPLTDSLMLLLPQLKHQLLTLL